MKLPIPFEHLGQVFTDVEIKRPNTDAIAECKDKIRAGNTYGGMAIFAAGSIANLSGDSKTIEEKQDIRKAVNDMPYCDVETVLIQSVIASGIDDVIEGIYPCPRCKEDFIPADPDPDFDPDDPDHNWDEADRIRNLKIISAKEVGRTFTVELATPVQKIDAESKEVIETFETVELRDVTMDDMIRAERKVGLSNEDRFNSAVHTEATVKVNGQSIDRKWKGEWGTWLYDRIDYGDTKKIQEELRKFGTQALVQRTCRHCGKIWEAAVDTRSFFASGLGA